VLSRKYQQRTLIRAGFLIAVAGVALLLALVKSSHHVWAFLPGLFVFGLGVGLMLTPSVNIVQSSFPEQQQGEISGLSRSISNLGSALGTAIAGTILVSDLVSGNRSYVVATIVLVGIALIGFAASIFLPTEQQPKAPAERTAADAFGTAAEHA
jgi:MFS family permease